MESIKVIRKRVEVVRGSERVRVKVYRVREFKGREE